MAGAVWRSALLSVPLYNNDRGAPIHATQLSPCPRAFYVEGAYSDIPSDAPLWLQKSLGPQWLVGLCYGGVEEVVVSISAYATDARLAADRIHLSAGGEGNFLIMGVPVGTEVPIAPERIADLTAERFGKRVAEVPRLIMRPRPAAAQIAIWQIGLEAPVQMRGGTSHMSRARQTLFAGPLDGWQTPAFAAARNDTSDASATEVISFTSLKMNGGRRDYAATRRPDMPATLELVSLGGR